MEIKLYNCQNDINLISFGLIYGNRRLIKASRSQGLLKAVKRSRFYTRPWHGGAEKVLN